MTTVLFKYQSNGDDYLVCDLEKNHVVLDARAVRKICSRNFGIGSAGLVAGSVTEGTMAVYSPEGDDLDCDETAKSVFSCYLEDAGYRHGRRQDEKRPALVGKVFLTDDFVRRNELMTGDMSGGKW